MKHNLKLMAVFCLLMIQTVFSQNINLKFKGNTTEGKYVQLDSIRVENISRSWAETLVYPDTILSLSTVGIHEIQSDMMNNFTAYPNPFKGSTNVFLTLPQSESITLQVYNMAGQRIMEKQVQVEAGEHHFNINLEHPQVYFLIAQTIHGRLVQKLINLGNSTGNSIDYIGTIPAQEQKTKTQKLLSSKPFQIGDVLKITGYVLHNGVVVASNEILQPQTESESFTLFFSLQNAALPTLTTTSANNITDSSAVSGGNITDDGGSMVTARGVCWSTSHNPTINGNHTIDGNDIGTYTSNITGLIGNTTYYVRAYATNNVGTSYGNEIAFVTAISATLPSLNTITASNITDTSAISGGNVSSDGGAIVTTRGVCWSSSPNPTISDNYTFDGNGIGNFTSNITGLAAGTTYYVRAYATNAIGTAYGNQISFTTAAQSKPAVFSVSATDSVVFSPGNLQWSATNGGNTATTHAVAGNGTAAGTWRFAPHQWDTLGANNGNISSTYTGWIDLFGWGASGYNNKYPYMTSTNYADYGNGNNNIAGTNYDWGVFNAIYNPITQTTDAPGTWRTLTGGELGEWDYLLNTRSTSSGIRYAKAIVNGITGLIIVPDNYSTSVYTLDSTNTESATYTSNIINLTNWTKMETAGCVFLPTNGRRDSTAIDYVGSEGYYWSGSCGSQYGAYHFDINMDYIGQTNAGDRSWGYSVRLVKNVNTPVQNLPTITTLSVSNITNTSAVSGGNITNDGGSSIIARGVCWSTSPNPTINDNYTFNANGMGSFTSNITELSAGTTYFVRAYAVNAIGTAYGNQVSFTTATKINHAVFSVSVTDSVVFSPGNLQWSATNGGNTATTHVVADNDTAAGTWRFASNQWDIIGANNSNIDSSYSGWIDLFGWGTSGYNNKYPYMTSTTNTDYGDGKINISNTNYDWGMNNAIYNPKTNTTDIPGTWRTLSKDEWDYLLNNRSTPSGIRYAKGTVWGISGLIIVPNNWNPSIYALNNPNTTSVAYTSNIINATDWTNMEAAGCVFLPAAGCRNGTSVGSVGSYGYYWSTMYNGINDAYNLFFSSSDLNPSFHNTQTHSSNRYYGKSVRLVRPFIITFTTTASNITDTSAVCGGYVPSNDGYSITARGVCWSTSQNPTINDNHTSDGIDTGNFTSYITGLTAGTIYYVRAYSSCAAGTAYGNQIMLITTLHSSSIFSVSVGSYIFFSPGNLQWSAKNGGNTATTHVVADSGTAAGTWRFAPHQWDTIGFNNNNISSTYSGWIDLFGWGTASSPYMNIRDEYYANTSHYGNGDNNIAGTNYDWGVYNAIYNPKTNTTDAPGTWRTLTNAEWVYLLNTRITPSGIRYAKATVNGVKGLIIVPDNWSTAIYTLDSTNTTKATYSSNIIDSTNWTNLETASCIFLPANGYRIGTSVSGVGSTGWYWSTSLSTLGGLWHLPYGLSFSSGGLNSSNTSDRDYGRSVRLVRPPQ